MQALSHIFCLSHCVIMLRLKHFQARKSFVAFRETVIVRFVRRTTLFVRKSTLIVGKCLDVRRTLRVVVRVFSSRRRTCNVSFLRFLRGSDLRRGKTFCTECKEKIALECLCLIWCEELSPTKAENDVVVFLRCPYRWVSHSWHWIATIRICRERKPVPEMPKACRLVNLTSYSFPSSSDSFPSLRWPVGIPDSEQLTEKGHFTVFCVF